MDHRTQAILEDGARDLFSGAAIAVIEKGGGERWLCFGTHAPGDPLPITPGSLFDLASLTKPFAGAALLALCGRGAVSLEDRAGRWFGPGGQAKDRILLGDLLGHTGGFPPSPSPNLYSSGTWDQGADSVIEELWRRPLAAEPGAQRTYSCVGYMLLGRVIEGVTGEDLGGAIARLVQGPLGSGGRLLFNPGEAGLAAAAVATEPERPTRGPQLPGVVHDGNAFAIGGVSGNAGLFGDLEAVAAFARAWLDGTLADRLGIDPALLERLFADVRPGTDNLARSSAGWLANAARRQQPALSGSAFGHTGFTGTSIWIDLPAGRAYVVLTNAVAKSGYSNGGMSNPEYRRRLTAWRRELHGALAAI